MAKFSDFLLLIVNFFPLILASTHACKFDPGFAVSLWLLIVIGLVMVLLLRDSRGLCLIIIIRGIVFLVKASSG